MKSHYMGYTIEVKRESSLGGDLLLYSTIFRDSDGYCCIDEFEDSSEKVTDKMKQWKERIDNEHKEKDPWGENEEQG